MVKDMIISASLAPASELLSHTIVTMYETVQAAKEVLIQKENFRKFSLYLERTGSMLKELQRKNIDSIESLRNAVEILNREVKSSKKLALDCSNRNKVYLLVNCRKIVQSIDKSTKEIARALNLLPLASLDVSIMIQERIGDICKNMMDAEYSAAKAEEEIMAKIESGIRERKVDRAYANDLMARIAEAIGISPDNSVLKKEFEEFKRELEDVEVKKNMAEELQMEQIIALLEKADATTSHEDKEKKFLDTLDALGRQTLEPLQSFYCPITQDVMVDPVETSSGMTFERQAIEKWFGMGNSNCPLTLMPLESLILRPNKNLRQSIEEWKERNVMITIASIKQKLESRDEPEMIQCLEKLQMLCLEKEVHREWVTLGNYIPVLVGILGVKNGEIRRLGLAVLHILVKDNTENQERICGVENALEYTVRSLSRNVRESKLAVQLLQELSKCSVAREGMGKIRGCIFSLVTISMKESDELAANAQNLLEELAFRNENVVQMANANYFTPLLHILNSGPEDAKMTMANTLSEIELTERQKLSLFEHGVLAPLLHLLSHEDMDMKRVSVKCLQCLSSVPQNGRQMIREGAVMPLLELLYRQPSSPVLRQHVAATIMHLAESTTSQEDAQVEVSLLESEDDIFKLFSLISLTGPDIQGNILRAFHAMCQSPSGTDIRMQLRQLSAVQVLVQLCEMANNLLVRANAVKLFCCLTEDGDDNSILEHVSQRCIESLRGIMETSTDVDEISAAMGIISNLPKDTQVTKWLLEAGALEIIVNSLSSGYRNDSNKKQVVENAVGALCRFTDSTCPDWQKRVAESGVIPDLVQFLVCGTTLMKQNAAISLQQLSESSFLMSQPVKKKMLSWCCSTPSDAICPAHMGICSVESSFCIVEANAVDPLVRLLRDRDLGVCEASLDALLTLIDGERLQFGSKVLIGADAVAPIIRLLSSPSAKLQDKSLKALHRLFQLPEIKQKFGITAHMALVEITQKDDSGMKSLAAKVLAQLGVLQDQSSFF